jgi:hypothetical protein
MSKKQNIDDGQTDTLNPVNTHTYTPNFVAGDIIMALEI